ncbi:hypothetical protein TEA_025829 [Camellia sinensis var. sinensis]|uniref:NADP-dependent oxidoreductase domain-containing protein n=1 Tax=Camellia sinensis var. sinensis TaxID=542762 RepID=A0A4S4DSP2_CAMSN|nr:hypothetical protein TEA_025829 [Camellia sinensis var. sinensis]
MEKVGRMKLGSQGLEVSAQGLGCMSMSNGYYGPGKPEPDMIKLIHHAIHHGITFLDTSDVYGPYANEILLGKGLGCMSMSNGYYGPGKPEPDMIKLIHHAIHHGITFLDTSDVYGPYANEILLGKAMKGGMRERVELCSKFGVSLASGNIEVHGDPAYVRAACEASLRRLDTNCIDLYYQHRIDTSVPIEITMGELKKLVEEGKIRYVGLSEASTSTIRRAHAVHPITAVQLEWSLWTRDAEEEIIPTCRELGIGIVAYSPLGRGFFSSGAKMAENLTEKDIRKNLIATGLCNHFVLCSREKCIKMATVEEEGSTSPLPERNLIAKGLCNHFVLCSREKCIKMATVEEEGSTSPLPERDMGLVGFGISFVNFGMLKEKLKVN